MTTIFSDNFNRPNGAINNNWSIIAGTWETYSNYCRQTVAAAGQALQSGFGSYPDVDVSITILEAATIGQYYGVIARSDASFNSCYYARYQWRTQANGPFIELHRKDSGIDTLLFSIYNVPDNTANHTLKLRCVSGRISVYVDGTLYLAVDDSTIAGGSYAGLYVSLNGARLDDFIGESAPTVNLYVAPSSVPAGSSDNILTLTTDANNWTAGTPGTPVFTCDLGFITAQTVQDNHTALVTYNAPGFMSTETLHDPLNGTTVNMGIGQVLPGDITEVLRRLGEYPIGQDSLTFLKSIAIEHPEGDENAEPHDLFDALDSIGEQSTARDQVSSTWDAITNVAPDAATMHSILVYLLGTNDKHRYTLIQVLSELFAIRTVSDLTLQSILDAIANIPPTDLSAVLDELATIRTVDDWTLGSVKTWIDAVRGIDARDLSTIYSYLTGDLSTAVSAISTSLAAYRTGTNWTVDDILAAIYAVQGSGSPDLAAVLTAISSVRGSGNPDLAAVLTAISGVRGSGNPDLAAVMSKLDDVLAAIAAIEPGGTGLTAPVWPGLAGVTLGTPVGLADQLVLAGPLHGVIVDVTGGGGKLGLIELGTKKYYYRAGEITFETDNGQLEPWQYIGFEDAIYCPRQMVSADNARFRVLGALTGTATPFTINP